MSDDEMKEIISDLEAKLVKNTLDYYLNSTDFNGFYLDLSKGDQVQKLFKAILTKLIDDQIITLEFGDRFPNMHIKALEELPIEEQKVKLMSKDDSGVCIYPSQAYLSKVVDQSEFKDKPFTLKLALGEPQLKFYSFDLKILKNYESDPRYEFINNDICGQIYTKDEHDIKSREDIHLKTFGYSQNADFARAVCVPLAYLAKLPSKEQKLWESQLEQGFEPYPEYQQIVLYGKVTDEISALDAFIREISYINQVISNELNQKLFRNEERPEKLAFLILPTRDELDSFARTLNILIADNLERSFFEEQGLAMVIESRPKGTLMLLEEWIKSNFQLTSEEQDDFSKIMKFFRELNTRRSKPVHSIVQNEWDENFFLEQRELVQNSVKYLRELRFIIYKHFNSKLELEPYNYWIY